MNRAFLLTCLALHLGLASATAQIAARVERFELDGIDVLILPTGVRNVVTLRGSLPAGDAVAKSTNPALATLAGAMLDQGTKRQNKFAIAEQLEAVGATISFHVDDNVLRIAAKCLRQDVKLVVELVAEQLREPAFDPDEFSRLKGRLTGALQRQLESTDARAFEAFLQAAYPPEHPNRIPPVREFIAALEAASLEEVKAFHAQHYGPAELILVLVGDIDAASARDAIATGFDGWTGGTPVLRAPSPAQGPPDTPRVQTVRMEDKPSVSVVWGQPTGLSYTHQDALALRVGTAILGSGFTGRLLARIRDREGLTYGIGATVANDTFNDGDWSIRGTFAPELLDQGLAATRQELVVWHRDGVTAQELEERKTNLAGVFKVQLATTEGLASILLQTVQRGLPLSWIDEYPEKVRALNLEQVNGAIKRHLDPGQMLLVRAGSVPEGS